MYPVYKRATLMTRGYPHQPPKGNILPRSCQSSLVHTKKMAPNLAPSTLQFIHDMLISNELTHTQIAEAAGCHPSTIRRHASNMNLFGSVKAPAIKGGRSRSLSPVMIKALCDHLLEKPHLYLDEMAVFLWDEFNVQIATSTISRSLKREGWSKKTAKHTARERNADLCDAYFHFISDFCSYHLLYVDESGVIRG